jgi:hypothetical protein
MFNQFNKECPSAPSKSPREPRKLDVIDFDFNSPSTGGGFILNIYDKIEDVAKKENERKIIENGKPRVTGSHGY